MLPVPKPSADSEMPEARRVYDAVEQARWQECARLMGLFEPQV